MPLDAAGHLAVARSTGRGDVDCLAVADQRLRVAALAAARTAQDQRQHGVTVMLTTSTTASSPT